MNNSILDLLRAKVSFCPGIYSFLFQVELHAIIITFYHILTMA